MLAEGALGVVGTFGPLVGLGQLPVRSLTILQVVAILVQLLAELFLLGDVGLDRDVVGDFTALLADRRHRGQHLVVGAILALVDEFAMPALAVLMASHRAT